MIRGGPLRLTVATAGAAVRAGISMLSMFSSAAINGIQTLLEDNQVRVFSLEGISSRSGSGGFRILCVTDAVVSTSPSISKLQIV
jgi:hypothetical protein